MTRIKRQEYRHLKVSALAAPVSIGAKRKKPIPTIRLRGYYLNDYGFNIGDLLEVKQMVPGVLVVRAIKKPAAKAAGNVASLPNEATQGSKVIA